MSNFTWYSGESSSQQQQPQFIDQQFANQQFDQPPSMMDRRFDEPRQFDQPPSMMDRRFDEPRQFDQQFNDQGFQQRPFDGTYSNPQSLPSQFSGSQQPFTDGSYSHPHQVQDFVLPQSGHENSNIFINAQNVIIQNGEEGHLPSSGANTDAAHHETSKTTTTSKDGATGDKTKSTTVKDQKTTDTKAASSGNPLGVPSAGQTKTASEGNPPSNTSKQATTTTTTNPTAPAPATQGNGSLAQPTHGSASDKTVPPLSTNNAHTSTLPASNIPPATNGGAPGLNAAAAPGFNAAPGPNAPGSTTTSTTTANGPVGPNGPMPPSSTTTTTTTNGPSGVQTSANDHPPVGTKSEKKHKSMKTRWTELKAKLHGQGKSVSGDVHPKDSRDGRELPSQNELSQRQVTEPHGNSADQPVIHKDANDATGKSVTGSDANPSKASMPFKTPTPSLNQAPVDAKAQ